MWKSRTSSSPARPNAGSAKRVGPPRPQQELPSPQPPGFTTTPPNNNNSPSQRTEHSPSISNRRTASSSRSPSATGTCDETSKKRFATTDETYWRSLARHTDSHQLLRDEISALRCRIQKAEYDKRAKEAQREKYNRIEKLFEEAKKTRQQHQEVSQMRRRASSQKQQNLWQEAQQQHEKTKLRMLQLYQEKHEDNGTFEKSKISMNTPDLNLHSFADSKQKFYQF